MRIDFQQENVVVQSIIVDENSYDMVNCYPKDKEGHRNTGINLKELQKIIEELRKKRVEKR